MKKYQKIKAVLHTTPDISNPGRNYGMKNGAKSKKRLEDEEYQKLLYQ